MALRVEAVGREFLPIGRDWMLVEEPGGGDLHFLIACDAGSVEIPPQLCDALVERAYIHLRLIPANPPDYDELLVG